MRKILLSFSACLIFYVSFSQKTASLIDRNKFFETDSVIEATLEADFGKFRGTKYKPEYIPAVFSCRIGDSAVTENIRITARGKVRREICYMPPMKFDFNNGVKTGFSSLGTLKVVNTCAFNDVSEQLVFKEYLIYKMYNLITPKSFRVRMLKMRYDDSKAKKKEILRHAFFIEDGKQMSKRNGCSEVKNLKIHSELTDRKQMTIVSVFQYMIGNTDYSITASHNVAFMRPAEDSLADPIVVPYDFDYAGMVNADYAVPDEKLGIEKVTQRVYRGYARTLDELNEVFEIFKAQKEKIYSLVNGFELLSKRNKEIMIDYLDDFFKTISNQRDVKQIFIEEAKQ